MPVRIVGIGKGLPKKVVKNDELPKELDTSDEWIRSHTGIGQRYICENGENGTSLGVQAIKNAFLDCQAKGETILAENIDLIVCATAAADNWGFPSNACLIQKELGAKNAAAFDLTAACSGFIYGLQTANALLNQMNWKTAIVVGTEHLSKIADWNDRSSCVLFGDGAGAAILQRTENAEDAFGSFVLGADGNGAEYLYIDPKELLLKMDGRAVYNFAVGKMAEIIKTLMEKDNLSIDDIDMIVCHQANERIIQAAAKRLGYPMEKFALTIEQYANTSSASIPIALCDLQEKGKIKKGDKLLLAGFGAGLTWGGCTLTW